LLTDLSYFNVIGYPQGHFEQSSPVASATAPMAGQPVISLPPGGQPGSYAPPAFLVPPPQFIASQTPPNIINYVPGPNGPTFPPNFQGYQGYNPSVQVRQFVYIKNIKKEKNITKTDRTYNIYYILHLKIIASRTTTPSRIIPATGMYLLQSRATAAAAATSRTYAATEGSDTHSSTA
jgi:hypothetical protein